MPDSGGRKRVRMERWEVNRWRECEQRNRCTEYDTAMGFAQVGDEPAETPRVELVEQRRVEVLDRHARPCTQRAATE